MSKGLPLNLKTSEQLLIDITNLVQYVCQRAARAIISEIGPIRVSTDALYAINAFIDEFLSMLITSSKSLDFVELKTAVIQLLPYSLGKNAVIEAEIELKQQIESKQFDFSAYERMHLLGADNSFPVEKVIPLIQEACASYCSLASLSDKNGLIPSLSAVTTEDSCVVAIAPIVVIYVTAVVEHVAEYTLNSVAISVDQADLEQIRVREVLITLLEDPQVNGLFRRMDLKDKLEKRALTYQNYNCMSPTILLPSPVSLKRDQSIKSDSLSSPIYNNDPDLSFDDFDQYNLEPRASPSSNSSLKSNESINDRPLSIISTGTIKSSSSRTRFNFFSNSNSAKKDKRQSISLNFSNTKRSNPSSAAPSPITPSSAQLSTSMDFDDLIRSGNTKKVSLTPNRLRSIEIKDEIKKDEITPWERFTNFSNINSSSSSSAKSSSKTKKKSSKHSPSLLIPPPLPLLPRNNSSNNAVDSNSNNSPPLTPASSVASHPSQNSKHSIIYEERLEKSTKSSLKSFSANEELSVQEPINLTRSSSTSKHIPNSNSFFGKRISSNEDLFIEPTRSISMISKGRIERPSCLVAKRASMGSRPPSFHESILETGGGSLLIAAAAAAAVSRFTPSRSSSVVRNAATNALSDNRKSEGEDCCEKRSQMMTPVEKEHEQQDIIYVIPPASDMPRTPIAINRFDKSSSIENKYQADSMSLKVPESMAEGDEEWSIQESEWSDSVEEEKTVAEWL